MKRQEVNFFYFLQIVIDNYPAILSRGMTATEAFKDLVAASETCYALAEAQRERAAVLRKDSPHPEDSDEQEPLQGASPL